MGVFFFLGGGGGAVAYLMILGVGAYLIIFFGFL